MFLSYESQFVIVLCMTCFTLLCLFVSILTRRDEPERNKYLIALLGVEAFMLIMTNGYMLLYQNSVRDVSLSLDILNHLSIVVFPIVLILVSKYYFLLLRSHGSTLRLTWLLPVYGVCGLHILTVAVSLFTGFIFYYDSSNQYHTNVGITFCTVLGTIELLYILFLIMHHHRYLSHFEFHAILFSALLPTVANFLQLPFPSAFVIEPFSALATILVFFFHEVEKTNRILKNQKLLDRQEETIQEQLDKLEQVSARLSVSQMQPHFIFNTLGSIEQLCRTDPDKAAQATHQLSGFLRSSLSATKTTSCIDLSQEIENIHAYVWLQQMRFGDDIVYEETIQCEHFPVPSFSIQPLVENSIKHGLAGSESEVIHIHLSTWETPYKYYVQVKDDGCGFDPAALPTDDSKHVGLLNIRALLEYMCNGRLFIESAPGEGSTITVIIPKSTEV